MGRNCAASKRLQHENTYFRGNGYYSSSGWAVVIEGPERRSGRLDEAAKAPANGGSKAALENPKKSEKNRRQGSDCCCRCWSA